MKRSFRPLITIGMPVRNCEQTLALAIQSLLCQTYPNWELMLIDDGSDDRTYEIAQGLADSRIRLFRSPKSRGLPEQLNSSIQYGKGAYFARMDGDDVAYPQRLEKQLLFLEAHSQVDLLGTGVIVFDSHGRAVGRRVGPVTHAEISAQPWARFPISHPTFMGRMAWFRQYGYRPDFVKAQDQDLLLRSFQESRFANLPDLLLGYREEYLDLKKIMLSRACYSRAAYENLSRQGSMPLAVRAVGEQVLKGMVDILATTSGLGYRILSHRAMPVEEDERKEWENLWASLQASAVDSC